MIAERRRARVQPVVVALLALTLGAAGSGAARAARVVDVAAGEQDFTVYAFDAFDFFMLLSFPPPLAVGDVDGDGVEDLLIGAREGDGPDNGRATAGEVHVVFGPLAQGGVLDLGFKAADLTVYGPRMGARLGDNLALGDLDGDGATDLVMLAWTADEVHVLFGPLRQGKVDLSDQPELVVAGTDLERFVAAGDVSGDGVDDLVVADQGIIKVLFGPLEASRKQPRVIDLATTPADVTVANTGGWVFKSHRPFLVADIDGDGDGDLVMNTVGAGGAANPRPADGDVSVLFGPLASGSSFDLAVELPDLLVLGPHPGNLGFGFALDAADVSGDGHLDLLASTWGFFTGFEIHAVFGREFPSPTIVDLAAGSELTVRGGSVFFGTTLATGDLNGDGFADLLMSDAFNALPGRDGSAGLAQAVYGPFAAGSTVDIFATPADLKIGGEVGDHLGWVVAAGDLTGEGADDAVALSPFGLGPNNDRFAPGEVTVVFGTLPPYDGDVKPGSCPNPLSSADQGVLPAAITARDPDGAAAIVPESVRLEGVPALRCNLEDASAPFIESPEACCDATRRDRIDDLACQFDNAAVIAAVCERQPLPGPGETIRLTLTAETVDGDPIEVGDCAWLQQLDCP